MNTATLPNGLLNTSDVSALHAQFRLSTRPVFYFPVVSLISLRQIVLVSPKLVKIFLIIIPMTTA